MPVHALNNQSQVEDTSGPLRRSTSFTGQPNQNFAVPMTKTTSSNTPPMSAPSSPGHRRYTTSVASHPVANEEPKKTNAPFTNIYRDMLKQVEEETVAKDQSPNIQVNISNAPTETTQPAPKDNFRYEVIPIIFKSDADRCSLTGTFNNWIPQPMNKVGDSFVCEITIEKGEHHEYKFVVNGSQQIYDNQAPFATDPHGNTNNVIN